MQIQGELEFNSYLFLIRVYVTMQFGKGYPTATQPF